MAKTYQRSGRKQTNLFYTIVTSVLICTVFLSMVASLYSKAEADANEMLHLQTKQIKDDLVLQLKSDRENLSTMASFASKLNARGEDYSIMFDSFKPIGLYSRIGILTPECQFITKDGTFDLSDRMNFEQEVSLGEHITGRTYSYSVPDEQVVRASVPFYVNGKPVGIMYGIVKIEDINNKYCNMAGELDAQLFVYDKVTGKYVIDTFSEQPGEVTELRGRTYNKGSSYDMLMNTANGFLSFKSIRTGENLYVHYSTIEDFNWGIILGRYEGQVFAEAHKLFHSMFIVFLLIILIIAAYIRIITKNESDRSKMRSESSNIRHLLLEVNQQHENVTSALKRVKEFSKARSAFFADTDGEDFCYIKPELQDKMLTDEQRKYFYQKIFAYTSKAYNPNERAVVFMQIVTNSHLQKSDEEFYDFLVTHNFTDISFAIIEDKNNHVSVLGVVNPKQNPFVRKLIEDVAVCFSIAIYNKNHLNRTERTATTDALTGAFNRVAYKRDVPEFNAEQPEDFACIYIDVNELHVRNNKYGHAAGDEMLVYIANALKEVFFGHKIYRMGGDEFLVFAKQISSDAVKHNIETFIDKLKTKGYTVAIGMSYRSKNTNCEDMVSEAEVRMYESKSLYYQNKGQIVVEVEDKANNYICAKTGIREIDTMISVMNEHYNGIYKVSLNTDHAHRILMPAYLGYKEDEENFSKLFARYVTDSVHPDFHRAVTTFLNYDAIKKQIAEGNKPSIKYKKVNGETVVLSIYKLSDENENINETLWVFAKK